MPTVDIANDLRTRLHFATVHSAGPYGTMPILCSVCGLIDVIPRGDFASRDAQWIYAKAQCKAHVRAARAGELASQPERLEASTAPIAPIESL